MKLDIGGSKRRYGNSMKERSRSHDNLGRPHEGLIRRQTQSAVGDVPQSILGILGGMGPAATVDFLSKLIRLTPAGRDQDHISTVICSLPQIPDRSEAILSNGPSPLPAMLRALALLERSSVTRVVIPCNTAHYWFDELQRETSLPILHIVDAVARALRNVGLVGGAVGLLATSATIRAGIYSKRLSQSGFQCLIPSDADQVAIMNAIRMVKAGRVHETDSVDSVRRVAARLIAKGSQVVILGCTELPLLLPGGGDSQLLDASEALADACVRDACLELCPDQ